MAEDLKGKIALVTGASSGIGAATAKLLARAGAKVAVSARRADRLKDLGIPKEQLCVIQADVSKKADMERLVKETLAFGNGKLDILVNNAGVTLGSEVESNSFENFSAMLDTNVLALANITRLLLPALKAAKGDIVNIGSLAVVSPSAGSALYAGTKAAITAFSDGLRKELTSVPVRVSIVHPGLTDTEVLINLTDPVKKARLEKAMQTIPPLQSEDLADVILFVVTRPAHVSLNEVFVRPSMQSF